tara:strand:- start:1495 stop:1860 length:366 start_codon:yes stop_codon:yes gene_type:complete
MRMEIEKVLEAMREDYKRWSMMTRTVHQNVEEFNRAIDIREAMTKDYCDGLEVTEGSRYWKIISNDRGGGRSVKGFIAKSGDKKFREGDMLKAAGWNAPARNFARGNVLDGVGKVRWTGIG